MTSKSMTFRFPAPLAQAIEAQAKAMGRDRTTVVSEALAQMFGLSLPSKAPITTEMLQQQVAQSEASITLLAEQLATLQQATLTNNSILYRLELLEQFSHSLQALLSTTLRDSETGSTLETVSITRYSQPPIALQCATPNTLQAGISPPSPLQLTTQLQPQIDLPERILAIMTDPVFVCDRSQRLVYINPLGARSLKLEQGAAQAHTLHDLGLPSALKAQLTLQIETVFATGRSITGEINLTTPLYGLRDYEYTISPLQGTIDSIEAVLFNTKDITERKQIETAFKEAEAHYQHLFEFTNDSILILDASTQRILNANTNAFKRLGYNRQQLLNSKIDTIIPLWNPDVIIALSQSLQAHGKSVLQHYLCHKDGTKIPVEINSRLIEYGDRLAIQSYMHELGEFNKSADDRDSCAAS